MDSGAQRGETYSTDYDPVGGLVVDGRIIETDPESIISVVGKNVWGGVVQKIKYKFLSKERLLYSFPK